MKLSTVLIMGGLAAGAYWYYKRNQAPRTTTTATAMMRVDDSAMSDSLERGTIANGPAPETVSTWESAATAGLISHPILYAIPFA